MKQEDFLSMTMLNIVLRHITIKVNTGDIRTRGGNITTSVDDVAVIAKTRRVIGTILN